MAFYLENFPVNLNGQNPGGESFPTFRSGGYAHASVANWINLTMSGRPDHDDHDHDMTFLSLISGAMRPIDSNLNWVMDSNTPSTVCEVSTGSDERHLTTEAMCRLRDCGAFHDRSTNAVHPTNFDFAQTRLKLGFSCALKSLVTFTNL